MNETKLESRQKKFGELILSSARNLLTLINSLLDFSKIEADKMTLEIKPFNLRELLDEIIQLYELAGKRKGVEVNLEVDPALAECYLGDAYRIRQVLVNLLGNGIKFTDHGSVQLSVVLEKTKDSGMIRFTITDSGPGIPENKQDRLFVAFSQVDNSSTRQYSGTGLGLSICKKLVELMNGTIDFSSRVGQGSSFWFTIRLVRPETVETKLQPDIPVPVQPMMNSQDVGEGNSPPRILIVDDDETNRMVLEEIFRKTDALIVTAENGEQAVQFCRQLPFDLILMDCRMPVMDGFEAT
ncbi:MAG: response regulator, partial [Deltaproteobacteria bacterium]|nr:response regulator [Deltaproteobacteria bacterium]